MKILDCTLRDGGYYTNWNFSKKLVNDYIKFCLDYNISIIELGYKSTNKDRGVWGICEDNKVSSILNILPNNLAFMIDYWEYKNNLNLLSKNIKHQYNSPFNYCRIAIKPNEIDEKNLLKVYEIIKKNNYKIFFNLMDSVNADDHDIKKFIEFTNPLELEGIYFADSYGNLNFKNIERFKKIKSKHNLGFHGHDNLGLALSNSLLLSYHNFTFIDSTLSGLGRGSGNTKTEQLILNGNEKQNFKSNLFEVTNKFKDICVKNNCGDYIEYAWSGVNKIHPSYVQRLLKSNLTTNKVFDQLKNKTTKYDSNFLKEKVAVIIPARFNSTRFKGKPLVKIEKREMILRVCDQSAKAVGAENVFVATDNDKIKDIVEKENYKVIMTNDNLITGTDRVAEASKQLDEYDIFINVQGDEPFIDPNDILLVIKEKIKHPECVINCFSKIAKNEDSNCKNIPKVAISDNNLIYISRTTIPSSKTIFSNIHKQIGVYAFNKKDLSYFKNEKTYLEKIEDIEILRFIEKNVPVRMVEIFSKTISVDVPDDLKKIKKYLHDK